MYDCLRANKSLSAWSVEGRVPFLDKEFLDRSDGVESKKLKCAPGKEIEKQLYVKLLPICYRKA